MSSIRFKVGLNGGGGLMEDWRNGGLEESRLEVGMKREMVTASTMLAADRCGRETNGEGRSHVLD
jgi:hypothetical protein